MCPCSITFVCPVYSGPARNVSRCDMVGGPGESARYTVEQVPRLAVGLSDVAARRTGSACVARIDLFEGDAGKPALIGDLLLEVVECPGMQDAPLAFASRDAGADALQILKSNSSSGAFSRGANLFGNLVVDVAGEAMFPPAQPAQYPLGAARAFSLEALSLPPASSADARNLRGVAINPAIRVGGYVDQTKVNAKPAQGFFLAGLRHVNRHIEEPLPLVENKVCLAVRELEKLPLLGAANEGQPLESSDHRPNAHHRAFNHHPVKAGIVGDCPMLSERPHRVPIQLVGVRNLAVGPNDGLRTERWEFRPHLTVKEPLDSELLEFLPAPSQFGDAITGQIDRLHRAAEGLPLGIARKQFDLDGQRHSPTLRHHLKIINKNRHFRLDFFGPESQSVLPKPNSKPFQTICSTPNTERISTRLC